MLLPSRAAAPPPTTYLGAKLEGRLDNEVGGCGMGGDSFPPPEGGSKELRSGFDLGFVELEYDVRVPSCPMVGGWFEDEGVLAKGGRSVLGFDTAGVRPGLADDEGWATGEGGEDAEDLCRR